MKKEHSAMSVVNVAAVLLLMAAIAFSLFGFSGQDGDQKNQESDSLQRLQRIGNALQIYRTEYGFKPVGERESYVDAGLPPSYSVLGFSGHAWSLEDGMEAFKVAQPNWLHQGQGWLHFSQMYWGPEEYSVGGNLAPIFKGRGEKMPILADFNVESRSEMRDPKLLHKAAVLRLDGTVDVILYEKKFQRPSDIFKR